MAGKSTATEQAKRSYRITLLGSTAVGKSTIISQFLHATFPKKYTPTVDDYHRQIFCQGENESFELDVIKSTAEHSSTSLPRALIAASDAFVFVYAVDDTASFEEVRRLRQLVLDEKGDEATPIVIVGNKCDVSEDRRVVERVIVECTVKIDWNNGYVETSAKDNLNIGDVFEELMVQAGININLKMILSRNAFNISETPSCGCSLKGQCCNLL